MKPTGRPLLQSLGIEMNKPTGRAVAAKERRAAVVSETFMYGEKNYRDPDWMFATTTHPQAMEWLATLEAAPADIIGEWGVTFTANCREWVSQAEEMGQAESIFTGKQLVMMAILMEKVTKRATSALLATMKDDTE